MRRVTLLAVAAAMLAALSQSWAWSASGVPLTLASGFDHYSTFEVTSNDPTFGCNTYYLGSDMSLVLRSRGRVWQGTIRSPDPQSLPGWPDNGHRSPCGSNLYPAEDFTGSASAQSPTPGTITGPCGGYFHLGLLHLHCDFALDGTAWLSTNLNVVPIYNECAGAGPGAGCDYYNVVESVHDVRPA